MLKLLCALALSVLAAGCALMTEAIDVPYRSTGAAPPVVGAGAATVSVVGADARTARRDRVSTKKNHYGVEMAAITAANDIPQTVADGIRQELAAEGYRIGPGHAQVLVEVIKFYNDFNTGILASNANAEVALGVTVLTAANVVVYGRYYAATGTGTGAIVTSGPAARAALVMALGKAVHRIVSDPGFEQAVLRAQASPSTEIEFR